MFRKTVFFGIVLLSVLNFQIVMAQGITSNIGFNSEYIYRGIPQKTSSAFAGVDFESAGFSAGVWSADVGDGLEVDLYGSYGFEVDDFGFSIGGTWYTYTGDFDDDYLELNLGASWKFLAFDAAIGQYSNFAGPTLNYQFYSVTASHNGFYGKIGMFVDDFDGNYYEAGYGNNLTVGETDLFDYAIAVIHSDSTLIGESDTNLVFTVSKTFSH